MLFFFYWAANRSQDFALQAKAACVIQMYGIRLLSGEPVSWNEQLEFLRCL